mmetsp:Transcript_73795/g.130364  ORF Transcript_73795/g.130364 Transcript_73795/m.130364 type:complete len:268 (+) Transcript_73795:178-981(+)
MQAWMVRQTLVHCPRPSCHHQAWPPMVKPGERNGKGLEKLLPTRHAATAQTQELMEDVAPDVPECLAPSSSRSAMLLADLPWLALQEALRASSPEAPRPLSQQVCQTSFDPWHCPQMQGHVTQKVQLRRAGVARLHRGLALGKCLHPHLDPHPLGWSALSTLLPQEKETTLATDQVSRSSALTPELLPEVRLERQHSPELDHATSHVLQEPAQALSSLHRVPRGSGSTQPAAAGTCCVPPRVVALTRRSSLSQPRFLSLPPLPASKS